MIWGKKLQFKHIAGIREHSKYNERLTTLKEMKNGFLRDGNILDVGCVKNFYNLSNFFGDRYFGVDFREYFIKKKISSSYFTECDLNKNKLPYEDNSFENVICKDVLEHLEFPHRFIKELFRVSKKNVLISLPNNWPQYYWDIILGKEVIEKVGYGLFPKEQEQGQRHMYFFNFKHACEFLEYNCSKKFKIYNIRYIFEYGNDGIISSIPYLSKVYNILGKIEKKHISERFKLGNLLSEFLLIFCKFIFLLFYIPNVFLTLVLYSLPKIRFYNLFCRQVWFLYKKNE